MSELLATVERVAAKIGEPITTPEDVASATEMLEAASNWVRFYAGHDEWTSVDAPGMAVTIAIAAAARGYLNPAGFDEERSDASTFKRNEREGFTQGARPTSDEIAVLRTYNSASKKMLSSIPTSNPERWVARSRRVAPDFAVGYEEPFSTSPEA